MSDYEVQLTDDSKTSDFHVKFHGPKDCAYGASVGVDAYSLSLWIFVFLTVNVVVVVVVAQLLTKVVRGRSMCRFRKSTLSSLRRLALSTVFITPMSMTCTVARFLLLLSFVAC